MTSAEARQVERTAPKLSLVRSGAEPPSGVGLTERSDDDLMLLARGGVDGAFDALIRRHQARVLRLALRYLGERALAADVAQNTFVAMFRSLPEYRANGKFKSYLFRVLLNQCRMSRRSARSESRALDAATLSQSLDPAEVLLRERRRDVEAALAGLSDKLRDVVLLRFGGELAYEEIAETLGIPLGTVKRRLFDAMAKLRETLEEP